MDPIKKALEKARKEGAPLQRRPNPVPEQESPTHARVWGAETAVSEAAGARRQRDIPSPVYSETRKVALQTDRLLDHRVFSILENNAVVDQYKLLRTMILQRTRPKGQNAVVITSSREKEGKTLTAVNLAVTLAKESRQTVLLVDLDLRKPSVHTLLGIDLKPGMRDYFAHDTPLKDLLVNPGIEALTVLPAGGRMPNSTEAIGSFRMEQLVKEIKNRYPDRFILFDTPALQACSDALLLSAYVDGVVLVTRAGVTTAEDVTKSLALLKERTVLGIVLNDGEVGTEWAY